MLRRFGTSAVSRAISRSYPSRTRSTAQGNGTNGSRVVTKISPPESRSRASEPKTSAEPSNEQPKPSNGGAATTGATGTAPNLNEFKSRIVPELNRGKTNTPVSATIDTKEVVQNIPDLEANDTMEDWSRSFAGLGSSPFDREIIDILMAPVVEKDVEITPDGLLYLPEIKYRRILNRAFGPGGWGIAPRTKTLVTQRQVTREYGLVCLGRLVSVSRGEMDFFSAEGITTAMEGCKSNALMRCCKDLGIASELWDPAFIRNFKSKYCDSKFSEKKRRIVWKRKDNQWEYPYN